MRIPPPPASLTFHTPLWLDGATVLFYYGILAFLTYKLLKEPWTGQAALARTRLLCAISFVGFGRDIVVAAMACFNANAIFPFLWLTSRSFELASTVALPMAYAEHALDLSRARCSAIFRYVATVLYAGVAILAFCSAVLGADGLRTGHYSYFASLSPPTDDLLTRARYTVNLAVALYAAGLWCLMALATPAFRPRTAIVRAKVLPLVLIIFLFLAHASFSIEAATTAYEAWSVSLQGQIMDGEVGTRKKLVQAMSRVIGTSLLICLHNGFEGRGTGVYVSDETDSYSSRRAEKSDGANSPSQSRLDRLEKLPLHK